MVPASSPATGKRPRRVLLIESNEDGTVGGSHQCLYDLASRIDRRDFDPVVLFYQANRFVDAVEALGLEVHVWEAERALERGGTARPPSPRAIGSALRLGGAIARRVRFLRRGRFDLVHLNNNPCIGFDDWLPACRLAGIPIVVHSRGPWFDPGPRWARWATARFDCVVAISDFVAQTLVAAGIPRGKIRRIYDGIDLARWSPSPGGTGGATSAADGPASGRIEAVMVGHLRAWKGQDVVLEALSSLSERVRRQLLVRFVGEAPPNDHGYRDQLFRFVRERGLSDCVEFTGYVANPRPLLEQAEIVIHASTEPEPFGLVVVEGMALGKAVVASDHGGPAEMIREGEGLLFEPRSAMSLAAALTRLVESPSLRASLAEAGRRRAADFAVERTVAGVTGVWRELLD